MILKKNFYIKLYCVISIFFTYNVHAQKATTVIPYELYSGKMIIKMIINGQQERFIFDTGAGKSSLSAEFCKKQNLKITDSIKISDVTSNTAYYKQVKIDSLVTSDKKIKFDGLTAVIMPEPSPIRCFDAVGLLGSDMLAQTICIIDSKSKTITIIAGENPLKESFRYAHDFRHPSVLPIFNTYINGQELQVLFDSGSGSFMNLKQSDFERLKANGNAKLLKEGTGAKSFGISGKLDKAVNYQVYIPEMRIGPMKVANIVTETSNPPHTLLGVAFMQHAKMIIDYPNRRLYCLPYEQGVINPIFRQTNFSITVARGQLTVAHIWKDLEGQIADGDIITHINGIKTGVYNFCDVAAGVKELKEPGPKMMTIQTKDNRTVNIAYKVEEIKAP